MKTQYILIPADCPILGVSSNLWSLLRPNHINCKASAKSKGALLVSAIHPIKNIIKIGNKGNKK